MASYTTFFLASPGSLPGGFPDWKSPLPVPVRREFRNPFTKQFITVETREPQWSDSARDVAAPKIRVMSIQGRYEDYLEGRLPSFVRESPHWAAKGLTDIELEPLLNTVGVPPRLATPLYAPPSSGAALREFPPEFIRRVLEVDPAEVAGQWALEMSSPQNTLSVTGQKISDGWTTEQASQILTPIVSLARQAGIDQRMYLLIEA